MNRKERKKRFNQVVKGIKEIKIQGARNIAKKAFYAYSLIPTKKSRKRLLSLRPTEPLLRNVLKRAEKEPYKEIMKHFESSQNKINKYMLKIIKNNDVIFTHCHSSTLISALIYAKKKRKKFEVYNTETRPLFQGRKTTRELRKAKIKATQFVDAAAMVALTRKQKTKKADKVILGADALLKKGIINKIGSGMFSKIAYDNKIPVYIIADSWKYYPREIKMEQRSFREVWKKSLKKSKIKIKNPAFEFVPKKYIKAIVSELGVFRYNQFLKKLRV